MLKASLAEALDRFVEAASVAQKWRRLRSIENGMEEKLAPAFRTQGDMFLSRFSSLEGRFQESVSAGDWLPFWSEVESLTEHLFWRPIQEGIGESMLVGGADAIDDVGSVGVDISFDLDHPVATDYLRRHGAEMVTAINDTTRGYINTIVVNGVDEGWSYNRMAKALTDRFEEFAIGKPQHHIQSRAHLIAITEAGNAYEAAGRAVVDDLAAAGLTIEKKWLTVGDDRVSDGCRENEGDDWISLDSEFTSGHQHPLRFPGCRCTILYRRKQ